MIINKDDGLIGMDCLLVNPRSDWEVGLATIGNGKSHRSVLPRWLSVMLGPPFHLPLHNLPIQAWSEVLLLQTLNISMTFSISTQTMSPLNIKIFTIFFYTNPSTPKNSQSTMITRLPASSLATRSLIRLFWGATRPAPHHQRLRLMWGSARALRPSVRRTTVSASSKEWSAPVPASAFPVATGKDYSRRDAPRTLKDAPAKRAGASRTTASVISTEGDAGRRVAA